VTPPCDDGGMCSLDVPGGAEIGAMSAAELEAAAREFDQVRRRTEAAIATYLANVERCGAHQDDGHRSITAWGRAAANWSSGEASRLARLGRAMDRLPTFGRAARNGDIGVAQMHALAAVVANPRVDAHLDASEQMLVDHARTLEHDDFVIVLRHWESLADEDGTHRAQERAHQRRRAHLGIHGERAYLDAVGGAAHGALMREIFDRFRSAEWQAEWQRGVDQHGDQMKLSLMERTNDQRNFDTIIAIFQAAAGSTAAGGEIVVNILIDDDTFQHHLARALGAAPTPLDPAGLGRRRCETDRGVVLDPSDVVTAACLGHVRRVVLDSAGVVTDLGRRSRLFTGPLRDAVLLTDRRCLWPGCDRPVNQCEADHTLPYANAGPTNTHNGGPTCSHHNRWKTRGYTTRRDANGRWHTYRPDGTEIGWPILHRALAA